MQSHVESFFIQFLVLLQNSGCGPITVKIEPIYDRLTGLAFSAFSNTFFLLLECVDYLVVMYAVGSFVKTTICRKNKNKRYGSKNKKGRMQQLCLLIQWCKTAKHRPLNSTWAKSEHLWLHYRNTCALYLPH